MSSEYFDSKENMTPEEREAYYDRRLAEMVSAGYERSKRVREIFDERNLKPSDIKTTKDLEKLPVISREKLIEMEAEDPPFGGFCDSTAEIDRIFTSPGPVYEPHLGEDDPIWARAYYAAGFRKGDIVLNAFSYHMIAAGLTFHGGLRRVGATVVPSGTSSSQQQVQLIHDLGVTGYTGTPSFLNAIIKKAEEMGYNFKDDFRLRRAVFGAEPLPPSLRQTLEKDYLIDTYQMYGATEVGDIAYECREKGPWHICEEVIVEIVDPVSGKNVKPGELGEIVVTRLNNIFFLFRFGTGDLSSITAEKCPCGRTSNMLNGIAGRVGDAVKVRGLFIAPSQLKVISDRFPDVKYQLVISREAHRDFLTLKLKPEIAEIDYNDLQKRFESFFREICTVKVDKVEFVKPGTVIERDKLIIDKRSWE